jgi:hypothetical protein
MCHVENACIFVENCGSQSGCSLDRNSNQQFCIATDSSVKLLGEGEAALHEFSVVLRRHFCQLQQQSTACHCLLETMVTLYRLQILFSVHFTDSICCFARCCIGSFIDHTVFTLTVSASLSFIICFKEAIDVSLSVV